jgi:hypothetical protein
MVVLEDELHREAKKYALEHSKTLSEFVSEAIMDRLHRSESSSVKRKKIPVFHGKGGLQSGLDLDQMKEIREVMDGDKGFDRLR